MKQTILLVSLMSVVSFSLLFASEPEWYHNLPQDDYEIIGYGRSENLEEAKAIAKMEIASSIQTQIISETVFETSEINGAVDEKAKWYLEEKINVVLDDLLTVRKERKKKEWFVALMYENIPIEKKFARKISLYEYKTQNQNIYLSRTPLIQSINDVLKCTLNIQLNRKNKIWYLVYENEMVSLNPDDFEKLFISSISDVITVNVSTSNFLREGEVFSFLIESNQNGYISIINVYENGECFIINDNQFIMANIPLEFPSDSSGNELVAGLFNEDLMTYDLYVTLFDKNKINLSRIQAAGDKIEREERHYKFNEVIEMMNEVEFCTLLIRTKPE